ncbi:Methionine--tRNA ligase, mitochondrial [Marasmius sp. AFHP31]|nr:Methionine--tRNA ligase, mitochondrial [Marasmius sp. AFHP31]
MDGQKYRNSANAEVAAQGRASEVIKQRQAIFLKETRVHNQITEAGIGKGDLLNAGRYGLVIMDSTILLARVTTLYTKTGGKAGKHAWTAAADSIGALSYISAQKHAIMLGQGLCRFAHVPANSFILMLATNGASLISNGVQPLENAWKLYQDLVKEQKSIAVAMKELNNKRKRKEDTTEEEVNESYQP